MVCTATFAFSAGSLQRVEVLEEITVLHCEEVKRQQDGVEVEAGEAAAVRRCNLSAVAGDADRPYQALRPGLNRGIDDTSGAEGGVPLDGIGEVMQLPEVDVVDAQPVSERCSSSRAGSARRSFVLVARKKLSG